MDSGAMWMRMKTHRWVYTLSILATLSVGILIGTVISYGVKGKEGQKSDVTPLTMPSPQQMSNTFSQIAKQLEPSVVNINTESTIKNIRKRRGGNGQDDEEDGGRWHGRFLQPLFRRAERPRPGRSRHTGWSRGRGDSRALTRFRRNRRSPRATSSRIVTSSRRQIAFAFGLKTMPLACSMTRR